MGQIKPEHIQGIIMNPFYAIIIAPEFVEEHIPFMSDEEWVKVNASLIQEIGAEKWLTQLLDVLEGSTAAEKEGINPFNAINIDSMYAAEHPPAWRKEQWVQGNVTLLSQLGTEQWLTQFLAVLEGDVVTAADMGLAPSPTAGFPPHRPKKQNRKKRRNQ